MENASNKNNSAYSFSNKLSNSLINFFAYIKPLFSSNTTTPTHEAVIQPKKKRNRKIASFKGNKTASLALPDTPKTNIVDDVEKPKVSSSTNVTETLRYYFNSTTSFFSKPAIDISINKNTNQINVIQIPANLREQIIALESKCKQTINPEELDELELQKIELLAEHIKEHAKRRGDLFFYLLVAIYGYGNVIVNKDETVKQSGSGSKEAGTQACHSSLFPNIKVEYIKSLFTNLLPALPNNPLNGTHFEASLNMTVELPNSVNAFDGRLEGRRKRSQYIEKLLHVLNRAAKNQITPKEGMDEYIQIMQEFFSKIEVNHIQKKPPDNPKTFKKIWEYEKAGTFHVANKNKDEYVSIKEEYIYLLLRLDDSEKRKLKLLPTLLNKYYQRIQNEIYKSPPVFKLQ